MRCDSTRVASPRRKPAAAGAPGRAVVRSLPFEGDDASLVAAMRAGRLDAGAAFYDRYVHGVHRLVFRLMGPGPDLDDVVHDTFVRALESLGRLRDPSALRSWVYGIAAPTAMIRFQRRSRRRWLRFMAPEDVPEVATMPSSGEIGEALGDVYAILRAMDAEELGSPSCSTAWRSCPSTRRRRRWAPRSPPTAGASPAAKPGSSRAPGDARRSRRGSREVQW